ncbi:MAG: hypothetical protein ACC633_02595 [Anaerolineales bacterium]
MNKILRVSIIVVIILVGSAALVWTGYQFGRTTAWSGDGSFLSNMMGGSAGYGMMNGYAGDNFVMGGFSGDSSADPLSVEDTREAVESYLGQFDNEDLVIEEIMIFDNNAYAIIGEESTGIGAFELLIDPWSGTVIPEFGPNMMWNLKYGMMSGASGYGMMGSGMMSGSIGYGMMDGWFSDSYSSEDITAEFRVAPAEAFDLARDFLNRVDPGVEVSDEITMFYGYYTIDTERDGEIVGMVSVNGFTGQVFPHTWHGDFFEMVEG